MLSRPARYRSIAALVLGCSLQAEGGPWTFILENRSHAAWILQDPAATSPAPRFQIKALDGDTWPEPSAAPEGFCGIVLPRSTLTFTVSGEEGPHSLTLHVRRMDGVPEKPLNLDLDLASSPSGSGKDGEPQARYLLTSDERLLPFQGSPGCVPIVRDARGPEAVEIPNHRPGPQGPSGAGAPPVPASRGAGSAAAPRAPENPVSEWLRLLSPRDLQSRLADQFHQPVLEALAEPLKEVQDLRAVCRNHLISLYSLTSEYATLDSATAGRRMGVIRNLLEVDEAKARKAFLQHGERTIPQAQARVLKALAALQRRLLKLPALHAPATAEALTNAYELLAAERLLLQCLACDWDVTAQFAPWADWRKVLKEPPRDCLTDLQAGWEPSQEEKVPSFIKEARNGLRSFTPAMERETHLALKLGVDPYALNGFNVLAWAESAARVRTAEESRLKAKRDKEAAEAAARERDKAERAEAHRRREATLHEARKALEKREQETRRIAAARKKEQNKQLLLLRASEKQRKLEEARTHHELEERQRQEAARKAEDVRNAEEAWRAEAALAETNRILAEASAEVDRVAAEAAALASQAQIRKERTRRIRDLLLIPRGAPLTEAQEKRVRAALERHGLGMRPAASPGQEPLGPTPVNPLRHFRAKPLETLREFQAGS